MQLLIRYTRTLDESAIALLDQKLRSLYIDQIPKGGLINYKQTGQVNKVKFRSRRDKIQSCYIPKSAVSDKGIYQ
ncbi:MAG: hypothetical protein RLZZ171_2798 [Cyanobacteriota bacterium]|jgi:hypothetical protein